MPASGVDESDFQRARIGGLRLAWSKAEPRDQEVGAAQPPLVLLHGFAGHRDDWIGVMQELARDRRVMRVISRAWPIRLRRDATSDYSHQLVHQPR